MIAWLLTTPRFADLLGEGARRAGGRWNPKARAVVYAADHPALAVVEYLVHVVEPDDLPDSLVFLRIDVPDTLRRETLSVDQVAAVDPDWRRVGSRACRALGASWLDDADAGVFIVPSSIVPVAQNILLNPDHPDSALWRLVETIPYVFEPRLLDADRR